MDLPIGVTSYADRHGKTRYRFRKTGKPSRDLPGRPGEAKFNEVYKAAADGVRGPRGIITEIRRQAKRTALEDYCCYGIVRIKARALKLKVPFDLTDQQMRAVLREQGWKCAISKIDFDLRTPGEVGGPRPFGPGVDRIIPANGYRADNIRIVCNIINFAMNRWGLDPLLDLFSHMYRNGMLREQTEEIDKRLSKKRQ